MNVNANAKPRITPLTQEAFKAGIKGDVKSVSDVKDLMNRAVLFLERGDDKDIALLKKLYKKEGFAYFSVKAALSLGDHVKKALTLLLPNLDLTETVKGESIIKQCIKSCFMPKSGDNAIELLILKEMNKRPEVEKGDISDSVAFDEGFDAMRKGLKNESILNELEQLLEEN